MRTYMDIAAVQQSKSSCAGNAKEKEMPKTGTDFRSAVLLRISGQETVSAPAEGVLNVEMTLEEYKKYIREKIAKITESASQGSGFISVQITDAGFEAMKNDSEYEEWVLHTLMREVRFQHPFSQVCKSGSMVFYFGETREEFRVQSTYDTWNRREGAQFKKSRKEYRKKQEERKLEVQKRYKKLAAKRRGDREYFKELTIQKCIWHRIELQKWNREIFLNGGISNSPEKLGNTVDMRAKAAYQAFLLQSLMS